MVVATCLEATCAHFYFSQTAEKHSTGSQQCGENDVITKKYILVQIYVMFARVCVWVCLQVYGQKKVQRKRSKAPRDIINEGSATSGGGSSQNNNCRQFGGPRNCLFVKHFSLFDMSTSSSDRATRRTEPNWKTIETRAKFSFFLSLSLVSRFWRFFFVGDFSKWATNWDVWDFWEMSEKCYRCFCHVDLKLKSQSPINGRSVMSGPPRPDIIFYIIILRSQHAKQQRPCVLWRFLIGFYVGPEGKGISSQTKWKIKDSTLRMMWPENIT